MMEQFKVIKKDMRRLSKQLNSEKGLTLKNTFDVTASLYSRGKESKPYVSVNAKGDYRISVFKLIVILTFVFSTLLLISLCLKNIAGRCHTAKCHTSKYRPSKPRETEKYRDEDWV